jgi:hypothetical protein
MLKEEKQDNRDNIVSNLEHANGVDKAVSCGEAQRHVREIFEHAERLVDISWLCWGWGNEVNHYWEGFVIALLLGRKPLFNWGHKSWLRKVGTQNASQYIESPMVVESSFANWSTVHELRKIRTIAELRLVPDQTIRTYKGGYSFKYFARSEFQKDLQGIASAAWASKSSAAVARFLLQHDSTAQQCLFSSILGLNEGVKAPVSRDLAAHRAKGRKVAALQIRVGDVSFFEEGKGADGEKNIANAQSVREQMVRQAVQVSGLQVQ